MTVQTNIEIMMNDGSYARRGSNHIDARVLAANTAESYTVPVDCTHLFITPSANTYVRFGATAAVPAADIVDGTGSELITPTKGAIYKVKAGDGLSFITAETTSIVTIACYRV